MFGDTRLRRWFGFVLLLGALAASRLAPSAATVTGTIYAADGDLFTGDMLFRTLRTPLVSGSTLVTGGDYRVALTNGALSTTLLAGDYRAFIGADQKGFIIAVPSGTNSFSILGLITNAITYTDQSYPWQSTPPATASVSGTVKTDVDAGNPVVYLKSSIDALLATNAAPSKLDITNGSAVNLSVSGTLTPSSPASRSFGTDADLLYSLGDSFTFGAGATTYTNTYVSQLAASLGLSAVNVANGSFSIADANWLIFPGWTVTNNTGPSSYTFSAPAAITEDQNWTALIGFNDLRTGAGTGTAPSAARYRLGLDHLLRYLSIPDSAKRWAVSPDASTGSWTESTWTAYTNKAASSSSGTLTFSNVIGSEIYVGFVSWATNYGGTISVEVDGAAVESRSVASAAYGNREYINGTDSVIPDHVGPYGNGKLDFCPHVIAATGLGLGAHTVVITAASAPVEVIWVAGNGWKRTLREGPNVFLGTIPRQSPWTGAGTDVLQASYNSQLRSAINTARAAGLRVAWAPVGEYYDPATEQSVDGVHPDNDGHTTIAGAFEQAMAGEMPQMADVGYQTEASQTGSFTTLSVSGTSSLVGNATLGGRLLVLPTAGAGGTSSRFGYGSVGASGISIVHSDTSLDRSLNLNGNSVSVTVNSTGAGANLSLGTSGNTVAIAGDATVANLLTVTSNLTTTGRLLVTPVTQSGGHIHRLGADSLGASAVQIVAGDTSLDRRLNLNGNSVSAVVNSTGAAANLSLGTSGNSVAIAGAASVAETLTASSTIELGHASDTTLARSAAGQVTIEGVKIATQPATETLTYSSTTVTVTAGKGPNQSSALTCTNAFTLTFASVADNDGGTIWVHPAATNCTVTLTAPAYGPSGTTLTITGGTLGTNHTVLAWKATTVGGTNVVNVNALNYYR